MSSPKKPGKARIKASSKKTGKKPDNALSPEKIHEILGVVIEDFARGRSDNRTFHNPMARNRAVKEICRQLNRLSGRGDLFAYSFEVICVKKKNKEIALPIPLKNLY